MAEKEKKEPTPAQIAARARFAAAAKARAAAKKADKESQPQTNTPTEEKVATPNQAPVDHGTPNAQDYADLQRQFSELKGYLFDVLRNQTPGAPASGMTGVQATDRGLIGTREKYILDPEHYPNPCERLSQEPKLARFAFDINFELEWEVKVTQYETKDGINTKEPRFEIQLNRIVMDEETGEPTDGRYVITRGIFHEDPQAALIVARENGVDVNAWEEKAFLDEMRYLRMRDWLMEAFYTPLPARDRNNKREVVLNGKLVQYFEVNGEQSQGIDFSTLPKVKF